MPRPMSDQMGGWRPVAHARGIGYCPDREVSVVQVSCLRCSRPIAATDVVEPYKGGLSHVDCKRPQTLTPEERALIFVYCSAHLVAHCPACSVRYAFGELAADPLGGRTNLCPRCRRDLTEGVRAHLFSCVTLPSEIQQRTKEVREAAQILVKRSQQAIDRSDVLIREAEAHLLECQQALRDAMRRRS